jgi:DNA-binding winged helix-turn-helix (wHTH) protein/tetratricopeptide (TPR) repeat protein
VIYEFDSCVLDTATQELWRDGELVHVEPQVLAVLEHLAEHRERVVTKIELLDEVWGDRFVSESALTSRIKLARKACGDNGRDQRILKTVHGRGYRFSAEVTVRDPEATHRPTRTPAAGTAPRAMGTLAGRDDELAMLDDAVSAVSGGARRTVFVTGEIGTGKSALVAEFLERNDDLENWLVLRGRCIHTRGGAEPYFVLLDAMSRFAGSDPTMLSATLERVAPSWLVQLPLLLHEETAVRLERKLLGSNAARMVREGADAFAEFARSGPVALVLEDIQWADDCTLDVIDLLIQRDEPVPLLTLGTARAEPGPAAQLISGAGRVGRATDIHLSPLDAGAVATLVGDHFGEADVPDALVSLVVERCDGIPLFATEILYAWERQGQVEVADGEVRLRCSEEEMKTAVPESLVPLLAAELTELDDDQIRAVEAAAVAGQDFDTASVAAGLNCALDDAEALLASVARDTGHIDVRGGSRWLDGTMSTAYSFAHPLRRDVVYGRLTPGRRAQIHGRIGDAIETGHAGHLDEKAVELAQHFAEAGDDRRAIRHLCRAGELATARAAHGHAIEFLTDALNRATRLHADADRDDLELGIRTALGPALVAARGWLDGSVEENYQRALELCGDRESCPEGATARYGLATVSELQGRFARTEALLTPLLDDTEGLAMEAHELVACSTFHQGAFERSMDTASAALDHWDEEAYSVLMARIAEHPASSCNSWSSLASWCLGRSDESLERADRAVQLGERNRYALTTATQQRAMLHQLRHEPTECEFWALRTREVGGEQDYPMRIIQGDIFRGWAVAANGRPKEGAQLVADGLARFREAGARLNEAYYMALHAETLLHGGENDQAVTSLRQALDTLAESSRSYFYEAEIHRLLAAGAARGGRIDDARTSLDAARRIASGQRSPALELRVLVDRMDLEQSAGDPAPWRDELTALLEKVAGGGENPDTRRARELLAA